jgi:hypothetical protein
MDPDADLDPATFIVDLQDAKKTNLKKSFSAFLFLKVRTFTPFQKKPQNSRNQGFSYIFCLMREGSGAGAGSESIHLTNGSGSGSRRPGTEFRYVSATLHLTIK